MTFYANPVYLEDGRLEPAAKLVAIALSSLYGTEIKNGKKPHYRMMEISVWDIERFFYGGSSTRLFRVAIRNGMQQLKDFGFLQKVEPKSNYWPQRVRFYYPDYSADYRLKVNRQELIDLFHDHENYRFLAAGLYLKISWAVQKTENGILCLDYPSFLYESTEIKNTMRNLRERGMISTLEGYMPIYNGSIKKPVTLLVMGDEITALREFVDDHKIVTSVFDPDRFKYKTNKLQKYLAGYLNFVSNGPAGFTPKQIEAIYDHLLDWNQKNRAEAVRKYKTSFKYRDLTVFKDYPFYDQEEVKASMAPLPKIRSNKRR